MLNKLSHFFMRRRNWTVPYALFLLVFVIVPLLLIVLYAFTDEGSQKICGAHTRLMVL